MIYNQNAKELFPDIDMILCAGDLPMDYIDFIVSIFNLPTYFVFGNHNLKEFVYYEHPGLVQGTGVEAYKHYHDSSHSHGGTYLKFCSKTDHNLSYIDPNTHKKTPLLIAGAGGSVRYNNGQNQYTERQMRKKLFKMIPHLIMNKLKYGRYLDIFLTHASPRHIHDKEDPCHIGFDCFNWFLSKFKPTYMVHGHIHLYDMREERIGKYFETTVVNAYAHTIIELPITEEKFKNIGRGNL